MVLRCVHVVFVDEQRCESVAMARSDGCMLCSSSHPLNPQLSPDVRECGEFLSRAKHSTSIQVRFHVSGVMLQGDLVAQFANRTFTLVVPLVVPLLVSLVLVVVGRKSN